MILLLFGCLCVFCSELWGLMSMSIPVFHVGGRYARSEQQEKDRCYVGGRYARSEQQEKDRCYVGGRSARSDLQREIMVRKLVLQLEE